MAMWNRVVIKFSRCTSIKTAGLKVMLKSAAFIKNPKLHEKKFIEILYLQVDVPSSTNLKAVNSWNIKNLCKICDAVINYSHELI